MSASTSPAGVIRPARPEEADALTALALRAKAFWPYDETLLAVFRTTLRIRPEDIVASRTIIHETEGAPDAVGMLTLRKGGPEIEHLWVEPKKIGTGLGSAMLVALIDLAREAGADRVTLNSDPYAEGFYRRHGFVRVGDHPVAEIPGRVLPRMEFALG
jgi:ribosomal protein S18 acetylase RimI-like enzyme